MNFEEYKKRKKKIERKRNKQGKNNGNWLWMLFCIVAIDEMERRL